MSGVVGEAGERDAGSGVAGEAELDVAALAGLAGDRGDTAAGGCLVGVVAAVEERADLGDDLSEVDLADAWQRREQLGLRVGQQQRADRGVEPGDGGEGGLDERRSGPGRVR